MPVQKQNLRIAENNIPVNIFIERRKNVRASIVKNGVNIRLPLFFSSSQKEETIDRLKEWASKKIKSSKALQSKLYAKTYNNGQSLKIQDKEFVLSIISTDRKSLTGKIKGSQILIEIPENCSADIQSKYLPRLISNLMSKCFYQRVLNRVEAINAKFFDAEIKRFSLKYTSSIWGSCSSSGGVTLSSRLLLAPQSVLDYVIVHELAHFQHRNHSKAFWDEVQRVMPDYQEKEKWLKQNDHVCDF